MLYKYLSRYFGIAVKLNDLNSNPICFFCSVSNRWTASLEDSPPLRSVHGSFHIAPRPVQQRQQLLQLTPAKAFSNHDNGMLGGGAGRSPLAGPRRVHDPRFLSRESASWELRNGRGCWFRTRNGSGLWPWSSKGWTDSLDTKIHGAWTY